MPILVTMHGNFTGDLDAWIEAQLGPALQAGARVLAQGVSAASPVLSGALAASWLDGTAPEVTRDSPTTLSTAVQSDSPYAHYQDTATVNAGYVERGLQDALPGAVDAMVQALNADGLPALWDNTATSL